MPDISQLQLKDILVQGFRCRAYVHFSDNFVSKYHGALQMLKSEGLTRDLRLFLNHY